MAEPFDITTIRPYRQPPPSLQNGNGGGTSDGMLERVIKLEADVGHLQADVTELRGDMKDVRERLQGLEVRVDHLPSKEFVVGVYALVGGIFTALLLFQDQIRHLLSMAGMP